MQAAENEMGLQYDLLAILLRYKAWAEGIAYDAVFSIPLDEALRARPTPFGNIVMTLNHIYVVDDIFRHHLLGRRHAYTRRNTDHTPDLMELRARSIELNDWLIAQVGSWTPAQRADAVDFQFVAGGNGSMTREHIVLHLVNHSTYHRGFVGDMLKQIPYAWPANDLTVFLRDVDAGVARSSSPPAVEAPIPTSKEAR